MTCAQIRGSPHWSSASGFVDSRQRAAFLDQACADDEALRREVDSLLAHESRPGAS